MSWRPRPRTLFRQGLSLLMVGELMFLNTPMAVPLPAGSPLPSVLSVSGVLQRAASWLLRQSTSPRQQTQDDRNASVVALEISPGNVTVAVGQPVFFVASALDSNGAPVGGVPVLWTAQNTSTQQSVPIVQGMFVADTSDTFLVQANALGRSAQVTVTAVEQLVQPAVPGDEGGWGRDSGRDYGSIASSPSNRHGRAWQEADSPPLEAPPPARDLPGNSNFEVGIPLLSLPGRGSPLSLSLRYNSQVWTTADTTKVVYNIDGDWPVPGWQLGFGKLMLLSAYAGHIATALLWESDGTRRVLNGYWIGNVFTGWTSDGSSLVCNGVMDVDPQGGQFFSSARVRYPNGTTVDYGARDASTSTSRLYPVRITDANGNYVSIAYVNSQGFDQGPRINLIRDTLGREVDFHYDSAGLLVALSAPDFNTSTRREVVRFNYQQVPVTGTFPAHPTRDIIGGSPAWAIASLYFPATSTGYWFDSYSAYGQLTKVKEQTGMQFTGARCQRGQPCEQGVITSGSPSHTKEYAFVLLNDELTYTQMTESWRSMDTAAAITGYVRTTNGNTLQLDTTLPNGVVVSNLSYTGFTDTEVWKNGLVYETRVYKDASLQELLQRTVIPSWDANIGSRPARIDRTDERGQMTRVDFAYSARGEVTDMREYDYGGATLLRTTHTEYVTTQEYADRWHFNLPTAVEVRDGSGAQASRTEYTYDEQRCRGLVNADTVTQHSADFDPYQTPCDASNPNNLRGNVSTVKRYVDATNPVTESISYDITGNVVSFSASCCELTSLQYTRNTQFAQPESKTRGARDVIPSARVTTSAMYDFNTGLIISSTDGSGIPTQVDYFAGSLRPRRVTLHTNATREFAYDDNDLSVTSTTKTSGGAIAAQVVKKLNGLGQLRRQETLAATSDPDKVEYQYDVMARLFKQSRPFRQELDTRLWTTNVYDALSRVAQVTGPRSAGSMQYFYNELRDPPSSVSQSPGQTVRAQDAWGREKWSRKDALGRLVVVVEPRSDQIGDLSVFVGGNKATVYSYNALNQLTGVAAREGIPPNDHPAQLRFFKYDGLGRLTHQKLAEKQATLDDDGHPVASGGVWSDFFTYDSRSNLTSHMDARGVRSNFEYNNAGLGMLDPLNRLQSVSYDNTTGDSSILPAPRVNYSYVTTGDVTRLLQVQTEGVVTETFAYDAEGRLSTKTQVFDDAPSNIVTDYNLDSLSRTQALTYPAAYGMPGEMRSQMQTQYDVQSRPNLVTLDDVSIASVISYNEASQVSSLYAGSSGTSFEVYSYDADTGLVSGQTLFQNQRRLMDVTYNYLLPNTSRGKSGQLVDFQNNLNPEESQRYSYDALGRLTNVAGGTLGNPGWWQDYAYDRYGNRTSSNAHSSAAPEDGPSDGLLHATAVSTTQVHLEWGLPGFSGGHQLRLERSTDGSNFTPLAILRSDQQSYEDTGLDPCTLYYYRLGVQASPTQWIYLAPPYPRAITYGTGSEHPAAPQNLRVRSVTPTSATLDFDYVSCPFGSGGPGDLEQPRGYLVLQSLGLDGQFHDADNQLYYSGTLDGTHEFVEQGLSPSTQYYFQVLVRDNVQGPSVPSNVVSVVTQVPPSTPTGLSVTSASNDGVALQWQYSGVPVTGFEIWRQSTGHGTHLVGIAGPNDRSFFDSSAHFLGQYAYWVIAYVDDIHSNASNTATASLPLVQDGVTSLSYDVTSNRISSANYSYDSAGNLTQAVQADGSIQSYQYDAAGRLGSVLDGLGHAIESYTYGASRHRLVTTFSSGDIAKAYQVWNGDSVLAEYEAPAASPHSLRWKRSYVYLGSRVLATRTNVLGQVKTEYHHPDRLGTRVIADGSSANYQETLPFGTSAKTATPAAASDVLFTSYHRSQNTGLDNAVNRHYSPGLGRFLQVDPIGMASTSIGNPQSLNLYAYVGNDPVNRVDPTGLTACVPSDPDYPACLPDGGSEPINLVGKRPFGIPKGWSAPGPGWDAGPDGSSDGGRGGGREAPDRETKQSAKPICTSTVPGGPSASPGSANYPFGPWSSTLEAAINVYNYIWQTDPGYRNEWGGRFYSFNGGYYAMPPRQLQPTPSPVMSPQGPVFPWGTDVGGYHTHTRTETFSPGDMVPLPTQDEYLLTPSGAVKQYDAKTGKTQTVGGCK